MWDAASAWFDEQCHVRAQDSNQRHTGPPAAERANLTTRPWGQPLFWFLIDASKYLFDPDFFFSFKPLMEQMLLEGPLSPGRRVGTGESVVIQT